MSAPRLTSNCAYISTKRSSIPNGFTARYHFDRLVWFEVTADEATARERERKMKKWPRAQKVALIQQNNPNWLDLSARLHWSASLQ